MLDAKSFDGWRVVAAVADFERQVRIEELRHPDAPPDPPALSNPHWLQGGGRLHALLLWREAGSPLPAVFNLGATVRITALTSDKGEGNGG